MLIKRGDSWFSAKSILVDKIKIIKGGYWILTLCKTTIIILNLLSVST